MLEITPGSKVEEEILQKTDDSIFCAKCGHRVTRTRFRLQMNGQFEHVFFNPAGVMFEIQCFKEAPGAPDVGTPTTDHTWFPGYGWNFAICGNCTDNLGWCFKGDGDPQVFFGLIKQKLTSKPS